MSLLFFCFLGGMVMALSIGQPNLLMRSCNMENGRPNSAAHTAMGALFPLNVRMWWFRLLSACSACVAHRQFHAAYGPFTSLRSIVWVGDGMGPMSAKNWENDPHSTTIPRRPYSANAGTFGLLHRDNMLFQVLYSLVKALPWRVALIALERRRAHWQTTDDAPSFLARLGSAQETVPPQEHRQSHRLVALSPSRLKTVKDPNTRPEREVSVILSDNRKTWLAQPEWSYL